MTSLKGYTAGFPIAWPAESPLPLTVSSEAEAYAKLNQFVYRNLRPYGVFISNLEAFRQRFYARRALGYCMAAASRRQLNHYSVH